MGIKSKVARKIIKAVAVSKAGRAIATGKIGTTIAKSVSKAVGRLSPRAQTFARGVGQVVSKGIVPTLRTSYRGLSKAATKGVRAGLPALKFAKRAARFGGGLLTAAAIGIPAYQYLKGGRPSGGSALDEGGTNGGLNYTPVPTGTARETEVTTGGAGSMGVLRTVAGVAAGAGALYGIEQLAERYGVRGGAGFIGARPPKLTWDSRTGQWVTRRYKPGLFNKKALKVLMKAKAYEKQAKKVLAKRGLVFGKRSKGKASIDKEEAMIARYLYGR